MVVAVRLSPSLTWLAAAICAVVGRSSWSRALAAVKAAAPSNAPKKVSRLSGQFGIAVTSNRVPGVVETTVFATVRLPLMLKLLPVPIVILVSLLPSVPVGLAVTAVPVPLPAKFLEEPSGNVMPVTSPEAGFNVERAKSVSPNVVLTSPAFPASSPGTTIISLVEAVNEIAAVGPEPESYVTSAFATIQFPDPRSFTSPLEKVNT